MSEGCRIAAGEQACPCTASHSTNHFVGPGALRVEHHKCWQALALLEASRLETRQKERHHHVGFLIYLLRLQIEVILTSIRENNGLNLLLLKSRRTNSFW